MQRWPDSHRYADGGEAACTWLVGQGAGDEPARPMRVRVVPATADRWGDLVEIFGTRGEDPRWCWCQRFLHAASEGHAPTWDNRAAMQAEVAGAAVPPGLLAYVDHRPAGWTRVGPRCDFPGVTANASLARVLKGEGTSTWWVTCFAVARSYRGIGVASALLQAAVEFARDHGAAAVEAHPVDVSGLRAERASAAALFTGTMGLFLAAGFVEVARTYPTRPVMRRVL
jgi:GNAT superfamily N-acetyltransferase